MKKFYCGIGSRETPDDICNNMSGLAEELWELGYTLRSGNAHGADQAFTTGCMNDGQIWLPWKGFNQDFINLYPDCEYRLVGYGEVDNEAWESVEKFHPNYHNMMKYEDPERCSTFMNFMARNYRQVRGLGEPDSEFVICWTPNGEEIGGTAQAIRIARHFNIPVYNMFNMTRKEILKEIEKRNLIN